MKNAEQALHPVALPPSKALHADGAPVPGCVRHGTPRVSVKHGRRDLCHRRPGGETTGQRWRS